MIARVFITIAALILLVSCTPDQARIRERYRAQLGTYQVDVNRSLIMADSSMRSRYGNLKISFYADSTFRLNMMVPFLPDSFGKWNLSDGGFEEWNYLYFASFDLRKYKPNRGSQFGDMDSTHSFAIIIPYQNHIDNSQYLWFKK